MKKEAMYTRPERTTNTSADSEITERTNIYTKIANIILIKTKRTHFTIHMINLMGKEHIVPEMNLFQTPQTAVNTE